MRTASVIVAAVSAAGLSLGTISIAWANTPAGNTALIAPLLGGPSLLAAGWAALLLSVRHRARSRSTAVGALAAAVAVGVLGAITWIIPVVAVGTVPSASPVWTILWGAAVPPLLSVPVGAALAALLGHPPTWRAWVAAAAAATVTAAVPVLLFPLAQLVTPLLLPTSVLAPLAAARRGPGAADTDVGGVLPLAAVAL